MIASKETQSRYRSLVGMYGKVFAADETSMNWYTIKLEGGVVTKLPETSLKVKSSNSLTDLSKGMEQTKLISHRYFPSYSLDSNRPTASYVSNLSALTVGAEVIIIATENVQQRAPQRVGETGYIKEVPVHPTTWFKVEFADGKCLAFRPSALLPKTVKTTTPGEKRKSSDQIRTDAALGIAFDEKDIRDDIIPHALQTMRICSGAAPLKENSGSDQKSFVTSPKTSSAYRFSSHKPLLKEDAYIDDASKYYMNIVCRKRARSDSGVTDVEALSPHIEICDITALTMRDPYYNDIGAESPEE